MYIALSIILGLLLFFLFVFSIVKYCKSKSGAWMTLSVIFGIPIFLASLGMLFFARNVALVYIQGPEYVAKNLVAIRNVSKYILGHDQSGEVFHGNLQNYSIKVNDIKKWKKIHLDNFDLLLENKLDATAIGVTLTQSTFKTSTEYYEFVINYLQAGNNNVDVLEKTEPVAYKIDDKEWLRFEVLVTVFGTLKLRYTYYIFVDEEHAYQIIYWSPTATFDKNKEYLEKIAHSFRFPK